MNFESFNLITFFYCDFFTKNRKKNCFINSKLYTSLLSYGLTHIFLFEKVLNVKI